MHHNQLSMKSSLIFTLWLAMCTTLNAQQLKLASYTDGQQKLNGMRTGNSGKNLAGVLILPAWKGIDQEAKDAALNLQKQGYVAFIADIYGEGNVPQNNAEAAKIAGRYKTDYKLYQHRIALALDELKKIANPKKIAVIGYCFGGTGALETARAGMPVQGVVSIHGSLTKSADRPHTALATKILVENPADDTGVKPEDIKNLMVEMKAGNADWQLITYANSKHTFTDPQSVDFNPVMAKRAWQHTLLFLKEALE